MQICRITLVFLTNIVYNTEEIQAASVQIPVNLRVFTGRITFVFLTI